MIQAKTLKDAFEGIKSITESSLEAIDLLKSNESLITRNEKADQAGDALFHGKYPTVGELTGQQKNWYLEHCNWCLPGVSYRIRSVLTEAVEYYFDKPSHKQKKDELIQERSDALTECRALRDKITEQSTYIDGLKSSEMLLQAAEIQLQEKIATLSEDNSQLSDANVNQSETIGRLQAEIQMMKDYIIYARHNKNPMHLDDYAVKYVGPALPLADEDDKI